ncbi:MAG: MlaE family lipid ABC transporter permease subunit [Bacteroidales bacterium]
MIHGKRKKKSGQVLCGNDIVANLEGNVLRLNHALTTREAAVFSANVLKCMPTRSLSEITIDLSRLEHIDSAGVMALYYVQKKLQKKGIKAQIAGGSEPIRDKVQLFSPDEASKAVPPYRPGLLENLGDRTVQFFSDYVFGFLLLAANVLFYGATDLFRRGARRKGEVVNQAVQIGVNAVFIVVILSFIVGYVIALHSAGQLQSFGANIFIVDLVVFSIMGQMGPLLAAILVAGRSGSAIAAEIATMKVTAELDALKTMGLNPNRFVVVPKLYACMLTMPFLIIFSIVAGIFGGGLSAYMYLDITGEVFMNRMADIMRNYDLFTALVKSQVYAILIVLTGSFYGFRVERSAEGVGKVTTQAVVVGITLVILADSVLGIMFY